MMSILPVGIFLFFSMFAFNAVLAGNQAPILKIKVGSHLRRVKLSGADIKVTSFAGKTTSHKNRVVNIDCSATKYLSSTSRQPVWSEITSPAGVLSWKGKLLAGKLQLVASKPKSGRCHLVNEMNMEDYLSQVLSREMHPSWPIEALKAQAIVARTYAHYKQSKRKSRAYHLENSEMDQVMGTLVDKSSKTTLASRDTAGIILIAPSGKSQEAFYHSKCGGRTLTPEQVWGSDHMSGYKSVSCPFCHKHGKKNWKRTYSKSYISRLLKSSGYSRISSRGKKDYLSFNFSNSDGSSKTAKTYFKKTSLRKILGRAKMPSHNYLLEEDSSNITVVGKGHGHGVGMCQYGAYEMAKKGLNYRQILGFYFPLMRLKKVY